MITTKDFSHDIDGLVNSLMQSAEGETTGYIGNFFGFGIVAKNTCIYLTHPELSAVDALKMQQRLTDNGWVQGVNLGIMTSPYATHGSDSYVHYIEVDRVTSRKEKLRNEMAQLARILEPYSMSIIR